MKQQNIKKIGIMGGTFNPIHYAHILSSEYVLDMYNLDKIIFIPTGYPPHKNNVVSSKHRYNMVSLAIKNNEKFDISDMEISRKTTTYTIDTLKEIKKIYGENSIIYFITGTDTINEVYSWKDVDEIFKLCKFIVTTRPKYIIDEKTKKLMDKYTNKIYFCQTPMLEISSTQIRKRVEQEKSINCFLPKEVEKYIYENGIYKTNFFEKYSDKIKILKQNLTENRFYHSMEVAKEARNLAINYDIDYEKAFLSGILHDCCKCFNKEQILNACKKYKFELDDVLSSQLDLSHSFLGSFVAYDVYGVKDEDILNSIKYHTTGRKNMSILEKILYIADYIEPTRNYFEGIEKARELAYKNLDEAMCYILKNTIKFNENKGRQIHYLSLEAYEFYKN